MINSFFATPLDMGMEAGLILALFFMFGLVMGRVSALLTDLFCALDPLFNDPLPSSSAKDSSKATTAPSLPISDPANFLVPEKRRAFLAFFFKTRLSEWGYFPFSSLIKRVRDQKNCIGQRQPLRPFVLELLMGVLFFMVFYYVGWKYVLIEYLLFVFAIVTASAVDCEKMILPDSLTLSGIGIGLIGALLNPEGGREFLPALAGMLMGGGFLWLIAFFYYALKKEEGLGGGDIKLLAWIGAVLTWKAVPFVILLSCFMGLLAGVVMMAVSLIKASQIKTSQIKTNQIKTNQIKTNQIKTQQTKALKTTEKLANAYFKQSLPFGPYLAFSALVYIFWGQSLARLYLSWFFLS